MKESTKVNIAGFPVHISRSDKVLMLGSCFAANIGARMANGGYQVCVNPFGTLFNPVSVASSLERLASAEPFTISECVQMGAGSQLWCSFSHYTKFARPTKEEFLADANHTLAEASAFFRECNKVIVTFGTAFVFEHESGRIVSNCLKRNAKEFRRYMLSIEEILALWQPLLEGILADKDVIFTVSPVRHMADTAHGNQLSKSTLLLACDRLIAGDTQPAKRTYFPSYEIMLDQLRDYKWYAENQTHPTPEAVDVIYSEFGKLVNNR